MMAPQQLGQYFASAHYVDGTTLDQSIGEAMDSTEPNEAIVPTPGSLAGRKRSRGDHDSPEDEQAEEQILDDGSIKVVSDVPIDKPVPEPVYGPGMTIVHPGDPSIALANASQSGTWVEEREEAQLRALAAEKAARPVISARKSQRVQQPNGGPPAQPICLTLPSQQTREISNHTSEPLIDEATRALGISWTRMDASEALQISQAAYSKWIQNHYPNLENARVWFENSAIPGYLVSATNVTSGGQQEEYYIFSNDLTQARLVTSDPDQLVPRLQMLPAALDAAAQGGVICAELESVAVQSDTPMQHAVAGDALAARPMELD